LSARAAFPGNFLSLIAIHGEACDVDNVKKVMNPANVEDCRGCARSFASDSWEAIAKERGKSKLWEVVTYGRDWYLGYFRLPKRPGYHEAE
jgi:hypothetical protein